MSNEGKPAAGIYKGRAIGGSEQYGETSNGNDQIALDLTIPALNRTLTTFLVFSENSMAYSVDRLRACGWKGEDVNKLVGIEDNEVDVRISYQQHNGKEQMRVEIMTNGGSVKLDQPMDEKRKRQFGSKVAQFLKAGSPRPAPKPKGPRDNSMPDDERFGSADDAMPDI